MGGMALSSLCIPFRTLCLAFLNLPALSFGCLVDISSSFFFLLNEDSRTSFKKSMRLTGNQSTRLQEYGERPRVLRLK